MKFRRLKVENFLSLGTVELDIDVFRPGIVLIEGLNEDEPYFESNAAGKTSLIEALVWCLYGEPIRKAKIAEVVGWHSDFCSVEVQGLLNGEKFKIVRRRSKSKTDLHVKYGKKVLDRHILAETQQVLDNLLGISYDQFIQTVVLEGGLAGRFSYLTDVGRKQLVEELVGSHLWELAYKETLSRIRDVDLKRDQVDRDITHLKDLAIQERSRVQTAIEKMASGDSEDLGELKELVEQAKLALAEHKTKLEGLIVSRFGKSEQQDDFQGGIEAEEDSGRLLNEQVTLLRSERDRFLELIEKKECPTCGQTVKVKDFRTKVTAVEMDLEDRLADYEMWSTVMKELKRQRDVIAGGLVILNTKIIETRVMIGNLQDQIDHGLKRLSQSKKVHKKTTKDKLLQESETRVGEYQKKINAEAGKAKELEVERTILLYWRAAFPSIRAESLEAVLDYLNARLEFYGSILSDGAEVVEIRLQSDKLKLITRVPSRKGVAHPVRSSGERRRVDLSIQFALSDLAGMLSGTQPSLLVIDEVLDTLDPLATRRILLVLEELAQKRSVWVTTHEENVREALNAETCLLVRKRGGVSQVEAA